MELFLRVVMLLCLHKTFYCCTFHIVDLSNFLLTLCVIYEVLGSQFVSVKNVWICGTVFDFAVFFSLGL
jgi:hypothetical protein